MNPSKFIGTGVAIVTPFRKDDSIDFKAFEKVIEYLIKGKVEYLVFMGTTGETPVLSKDEKKAVACFALDTVQGRVPLVLGIGGNNTSDVIDQLKTIDSKGFDAILSVAPYYNKPSQEGLIEHFKKVSSYSPLPVIIYNVPGRTGINISAETTLRLARDVNTNIIAVKEASGNMSQIMKIIGNKPDDFLVISGDDAITLPMISTGASGVISVVANAFPSGFSEMVRAAIKGDFKIARELHYRYMELIDLIFADGSPSGIKAALHSMGLIENHLRLPLVPVSKTLYGKIAKAVETLQK